MQWFFALTLLVSATLLFVVEPMFAKKVLPLLGGSPSVWNTCLVFYQAALLAGYVYAHWTVKWLGPRRQAMLHVALLCLPWLVLALPVEVPPLAVPADWSPGPDSDPVWWLWLVLSARLGLPFLVVAATAPTIQSWFADTTHRSAKDPYFLYAASNLGSMIGLAAYPLLIEQRLTLTEQSWWWVGGYGLLMALVTGCAMLLWMSRRTASARPLARKEIAAEPGQLLKPEFEAGGQAGEASALQGEEMAAPEAGETPAPQGTDTTLRDEPPTLGRRLRWLALALVPSSLLLGVTMHITTDTPSMPLLWAFPLALYLLSFVLVFAKHRILPHRWMVGVQSLLLVIVAGTLYLGGLDSSEVAATAILHLLAFFATAMVCHGELAADRPASRHLTEFYLWMSLGGVVGGLLNALLAPALFNSVLEYPLMLVAVCLLRPRPKDRYDGLSLKLGIALGVFSLVVLYQAVDSVDWEAVGKSWTRCWDGANGSGPSRALLAWTEFDATYKFQLLALGAVGGLALWMLAMTVLARVKVANGPNALKIRLRARDILWTGAMVVFDVAAAGFILAWWYPAMALVHRLELLGLAAVWGIAVWLAAMTVWSWFRRRRESRGLQGPGPADAATRFSVEAGAYDVILMLLVAVVFTGAAWIVQWERQHNLVLKTELVGLCMLAAFGLARRPARFAVALAVLLGVSWVCCFEKPPLHIARSFFGVLRVELMEETDEWGDYRAHRLLHGTTLHGMQGIDPEDAAEAWTYYHVTGPVGQIFDEMESRPIASQRPPFISGGRIGVVGLGTGSIAAYGQPGQKLTYFEIDPEVKRIAEDPRFFTYLRDCKAGDGETGAYQIVLGDARLRLAQTENEFDLLLVDAFSSDSIPIHLLTREAIALYKAKLADGGLLAIHISNRHLDLEPVLLNLAADAGLVAAVLDDDDETARGKCSSRWVVLAGHATDLGELGAFDVLLVDVPQFDSLPLSRLAPDEIQRKVEKLADGGVVVIHFSSRPDGLDQELDGLMSDGNYLVGVYEGEENPRGPDAWVLVARARKYGLDRLDSMFVPEASPDAADGTSVDRESTDAKAGPMRLKPRRSLRVWTDDFSNIVSVIRFEHLNWKWLPGRKLWDRWKKWNSGE